MRIDTAIASRLVASSSARPLRNLHATAITRASETHAEAQKRQQEREGIAKLVNPHVILGHRPGDETKWRHCDLAKILVTPEEIRAAPIIPITALKPGSKSKSKELPKYYNFGIGDKEKSMLFEALPTLTMERTLEVGANEKLARPEFLNEQSPTAEFVENVKANMLARIVDLRNANARGIAFENRRRCIAAFSESGKPDDTGRPEVQGTIHVFHTTVRLVLIRVVCPSRIAHHANTTSMGSLDEEHEGCVEPSESP
ncbi:hypothetical protein NM688_g4046 [Phlebia brevispora]|uniref:Uncharacterized protein n=1 Tax=Phlebia brevispora TaxID=194682 RepID=A0ACC1T465_9APHY|nr:hypothetical protein NM688_g4046 [Phlebia brevispora]